MMFFIPLIVLVILGALGYWLYLRFVRNKKIAGIVDDPNPLAAWTYTPQEWERAIEDEFSWARRDGGSAQIRISAQGIYIKTDSQSRLIELATGPKVVTYAGYAGGERAPLKLRVRWRVVTHRQHDSDEIKYHNMDVLGKSGRNATKLGEWPILDRGDLSPLWIIPEQSADESAHSKLG